MSFADTLAEHRRITILRFLDASGGYSVNESILYDAVNAHGVVSTRAQVCTELAWLRDQGLVTIEDLRGLMIATLTSRGQDIATGRTTVPGVKRPSAKG